MGEKQAAKMASLRRWAFVGLVLSVITSFAVGSLTAGTWGGTHWKLVVNSDNTTGTIEGDCSLGPVTDFDGTNTSAVSFSSNLVLQFEDPGTSTVNCSDGVLDAAGTTLTGTLVVGTYSETYKVTLNAEPDLYKCVNCHEQPSDDTPASWDPIIGDLSLAWMLKKLWGVRQTSCIWSERLVNAENPAESEGDRLYVQWWHLNAPVVVVSFCRSCL